MAAERSPASWEAKTDRMVDVDMEEKTVMGYVVKARYWHHPHTLQVEMIRFNSGGKSGGAIPEKAPPYGIRQETMKGWYP